MPNALTAQPSNRVTPQVCAVRLIDRRTGSVHRVNGAPLVIFARDTAAATAELMANRDQSLWDIRIDPLPVEVTR
jgi:hypothetical protein